MIDTSSPKRNGSIPSLKAAFGGLGIPVIGPEFFKNRRIENDKGDFWLLVKCAGAIIASALFFLLLAVVIVIFGSSFLKVTSKFRIPIYC